MSREKTPLEMFYHWEEHAPHKVYLRQPVNRTWHEYSWREVADRVRKTASFIRAQNFPANSTIAVLSANCADWIVVDLAIMLSGHVSVPLYAGQDAASIEYILEHSETRLIFLGAFDLEATADEILPPTLPRVAIHRCRARTDYQLESIVTEYAAFTSKPQPDPESVFTIIYTSGTTGNPKGVMHCYATPGQIIPQSIKKLKMDGDEENHNHFFSYLPLSHVAERSLIEMSSLYCSATISFSEGPETFVDELKSVRPTVFFSVPRLWHKFKLGVDARYTTQQQIQFGEIEKASVRKELGLDRAKTVITGSAGISTEILKWFREMGVVLRDGYGMTETFGNGCMFLAENPIPGCVGSPILEETKVKLSENNEICFQSKSIMKGYLKDGDKTSQVVVDGWYLTGDSGRFDERGNLWVTGRLSEAFKTTKGVFIKPTALESHFEQVGELGQLCIFGYGRDQPLLLASLSELGQRQPPKDLSLKLEAVLDSINSGLSPAERIAQIFITATDWNIEDGLLTHTQKLKRNVIEEAFSEWVSKNIGIEKIVWQTVPLAPTNGS